MYDLAAAVCEATDFSNTLPSVITMRIDEIRLKVFLNVQCKENDVLKFDKNLSLTQY